MILQVQFVHNSIENAATSLKWNIKKNSSVKYNCFSSTLIKFNCFELKESKKEREYNTIQYNIQ